MEILIDSREKQRGQEALNHYNNKNDCEARIRQLNVGDYLFNQAVVFEYKTIADCFTSITDGRLHNQAINQSTNYDYHFIMIEGGTKEIKAQLAILKNNNVQFNIKQYYGMLARLNTFTTVLHAPNQKTAFNYMLIQAKKCLDNRTISKTFPTKTSNTAYNFFKSSIPGVGDKTAQNIVNTLELETLKDLLTVKLEDLTQIKGISTKKAERIMEKLKG